ncbi:MAG TPA: hypothetical protein VF793_13850 [Telluria sp.]
MSNNISASFGASPSAVPARAAGKAKPSIWRRMFDAWLLSYSNRTDPDGNVFLEL